MFEIFEKAGMPKGSVNLILGPGGSVGSAIAAHPGISMVTFTGSTAVGQDIMRCAAANVKKIGLELGGKSPNIIFADADLEGAVEWAMIGIFFNQGEVCSAGSRILIEESFKETFLRRLVERTNAITLGNPLNNPDMGPMVSESQMNDVLGFIRKGVEEGATLVCGGARYTEGECAKGYFVQPTIFDNCTSEMTIVREEIFGPVVTIQTFRTEEEAVALANDTIYGLAGGVFTADGARALRVIKEIRAGITWVNCYNPTFNEAPWGYKMSGIGRELGVHGLEGTRRSSKSTSISTPARWAGMNTDRMGRCPAGEKSQASGFGAFLSETGQGRRNYSAVYRMRMVATCARVAVALGERVVSVVPEIRPSPMAHFMASVA